MAAGRIIIDMAPVSRREHFTEHRVRHSAHTESISRCSHQESNKQGCLQAGLVGQLGDGGQDGADAEERD